MKLTKRERAHALVAIRYLQANIDDVRELKIDTLEGIKPMASRDLDKLYLKMLHPDFEVGDEVLCSPLNLPNGKRAPNRNFEEPFTGTLVQITHDLRPKKILSSYLVADARGRTMAVDLDQLSHPEGS